MNQVLALQTALESDVDEPGMGVAEGNHSSVSIICSITNS